ncbi:hypothetical protein IHE44_0001246 [Lamprotornis superbus]|uniref:F-box only protein 32 n=1 Tax=Lamprotornis superbus TaxID=245042 RepID=A0A835NSP9_9PASS|nr:hypothetical protein IHE44_0001246 [Lamprotornis superbus]
MIFCKKDDHNKENLFNSINYDVAAKKRKKDLLNNKAKTQYFHQEKWIYVHKGSTKERHGYCTLGEAFNRLDFSSAILDSRRFNYVVRLLELIAKSQLTSLSGIAQKNYMNILEKVVQKVLEDQQNIRLIRELLQTLYTSLCTLVQRVGKSVLVGNINMWVHRMESILHWQQQLNNIQITRPAFKGTTFTDLPLCLQLNIMQRLSDGRDLVSLGQVAPDLQVLSEDRLLWKKLCQYHFTDRQIRKRLILSDKGQLDWKKMYFKLIRVLITPAQPTTQRLAPPLFHRKSLSTCSGSELGNIMSGIQLTGNILLIFQSRKQTFVTSTRIIQNYHKAKQTPSPRRWEQITGKQVGQEWAAAQARLKAHSPTLGCGRNRSDHIPPTLG